MATTFRCRATITYCMVVAATAANSCRSAAGEDSISRLEDASILKHSNVQTDSNVLLQTKVKEIIEGNALLYDKLVVSPPHEHLFHQHSEKQIPLWTHPLVLGALLGLFIVGPDHLGTLMALSTLTTGMESFKRGFYWGAGHSIGVMLLSPIFLFLEYATSTQVSGEAWEYYGNVFIGTSMIAVSIYFIHNQDSYLERLPDGSYVAKGCACCEPEQFVPCSEPSTATPPMNFWQRPTVRGMRVLTPEEAETFLMCAPCLSCKEARSFGFKCNTKTSHPGVTADPPSNWLFSNSLLGIFQGLCCPIGMTAGTGFITRVTATASTPMLLAFLVEFFVASGVGAGLIALTWGCLSLRGSGNCISGKVVYLATCIMLLLFGIVWVVALNLGVLDHIDFGEKIHHKLALLVTFRD